MLKRNDENKEVLVISTDYFSDRLQETHLRVGDASAGEM